jgi:hypothetical protein
MRATELVAGRKDGLFFDYRNKIEVVTSTDRLRVMGRTVCSAGLFKNKLRGTCPLIVQCVVLFLFTFIIFLISPIRTSFDSRWSIHTSMSLLKGNWGRLDDYSEVLRKENFYQIIWPDGHPHTTYPVGVSLLAAPFVSLISRANPALDERLKGEIPDRLEAGIASFYAALGVVLVFLFANEITSNRPLAALVALIFSFCTPLWSTASRALWQHGPLIFVYCAILFMLMKVEHRERVLPFLAIPLALAYVTRPTAALVVFWISFFVLVRHARVFLAYSLLGMAALLPWFVYNEHIYGSLLPPYYRGASTYTLAISSTFGEALMGHLFSPARGLIIYSPVFVFSFWGMVLALRDPSRRFLNMVLIGIILSHWVLVSALSNWWGGSSYGPRLMADIIPFLCYFLIYALVELRKQSSSRFSRSTLVGVFLIAVVFSAFTHYRGAFSWSVYEWNFKPTNIDRDYKKRLWDWRDPPFLRGLTGDALLH